MLERAWRQRRVIAVIRKARRAGWLLAKKIDPPGFADASSPACRPPRPGPAPAQLHGTPALPAAPAHGVAFATAMRCAARNVRGQCSFSRWSRADRWRTPRTAVRSRAARTGERCLESNTSPCVHGASSSRRDADPRIGAVNCRGSALPPHIGSDRALASGHAAAPRRHQP